MSCQHCTHCQDNAKTTQENANLYPLGTHLIHPKHGHVVYWRNDIDRDGTPGRGHYVHKAADPNHDLFYVYGDDFQVATVDIDLPASLVAFFAADDTADTIITEASVARRPFRKGQRVTVTYANLHHIQRIAYWARDMGEGGRAVRNAAAKVGKQVTAALA